MIKPYSLIEIEWYDAAYAINAGWRTEQDANCWFNEQVIYKESGYYLKQNNNFILICGGYFQDKTGNGKQVSGIRVIPTGCIKNIKTVK